MDYDLFLMSGPGSPNDDSDCVGTCPTCHGKGELAHWEEETDIQIIDCPECLGTGVVAG